MISWIKRLLIAIDQLANVLFEPIFRVIFFGDKGWGDEDETISSVLGKNYKKCRACRFVCRILSHLDWTSTQHCRDSIEEDEGR